MLIHVHIFFTRSYLHVQNAYLLACKLCDIVPSDIDLEECVSIIEAKCRDLRELKCQCKAHQRLKVLNDQEMRFETLLGQLQCLDVRKKLKDQSGAHTITEILSFLADKHGWRSRCMTKSATLQTSCALYDFKNNDLKLYNSTPDFVLADTQSKVLAVGEIESSPFVQMMVAGIGHIADPLMKYMLGVCVSKERCIDLYFIEKDIDIKFMLHKYTRAKYLSGSLLQTCTVCLMRRSYTTA